MKPIARGEILGLADYETIRTRFRDRVIAEKKVRRVPVGKRISAVFENRDTVMLQIQEMVRTERMTREGAIQHEIDTYNELLPGDDELSVTLMIEIPEREEREAFLVSAKGLEQHVWLVAGTQRVAARSIDRGGDHADRTTALHYLKFTLPPSLASSLRALAKGNVTLTQLELLIDHPAVRERAAIPAETVFALCEDLEG